MYALIRFVILTALFGTAVANAATPQEQRLLTASEVLSQFSAIPEQNIPNALLNNAHAVAVLPDVLKIGFVFGGRYGKGVLSVKKEDGRWSSPVFISITGGSFGWQAGAESTDLVLVFSNRRGLENIANGKLTLGADASVAAGPVGRHTSASTDLRLKAEVYSYSRSRGIFAGVTLQGAALRIDHRSNADYYKTQGITVDTILAGNTGPLPVSAYLVSSALGKRQRLATAPPTSQPTVTPAPDNATGVRTYGLGEAAVEPGQSRPSAPTDAPVYEDNGSGSYYDPDTANERRDDIGDEQYPDVRL